MDTPTTPSTYLSQNYVHLRGYKLTMTQHLNVMQRRTKLNKVSQNIRENLSSKNVWNKALPKKYGAQHIVTDADGIQRLFKNLDVILKKLTFKEKPSRFEIVARFGHARTLTLSAN